MAGRCRWCLGSRHAVAAIDGDIGSTPYRARRGRTGVTGTPTPCFGTCRARLWIGAVASLRARSFGAGGGCRALGSGCGGVRRRHGSGGQVLHRHRGRGGLARRRGWCPTLRLTRRRVDVWGLRDAACAASHGHSARVGNVGRVLRSGPGWCWGLLRSLVGPVCGVAAAASWLGYAVRAIRDRCTSRGPWGVDRAAQAVKSGGASRRGAIDGRRLHGVDTARVFSTARRIATRCCVQAGRR
jgi:hypothetical protein